MEGALFDPSSGSVDSAGMEHGFKQVQQFSKVTMVNSTTIQQRLVVSLLMHVQEW